MPTGMQDQPSPAASIVRTLRDGYWDRTEVIRLRDGTHRVRKSSKGLGVSGPWGVSTLRSEIQYLLSLEDEAASCFAPILAAWDDGERVGYEMAFLDHLCDAAGATGLDPSSVRRFQDALGQVVFGRVHRAVAPDAALADHVRETIVHVLDELTNEQEFRTLIESPKACINGETVAGTRSAAARVLENGAATAVLTQEPAVRLHGDLFLENILVPSDESAARRAEHITLIDPVSVAGVSKGHPLFDLVKYESYATGELPAMRSGAVDVTGFDDCSKGRYTWHLQAQAPPVARFRGVDWHTSFRQAYLEAYGEIHESAYALLEAYFALVMALCTSGLQRRARLLKATVALNCALGR